MATQGKIFISYRRQETAWPARQLYEVLVARFGPGSVFKDVDDIDPGDDFVERITSAVAACDVLLALIGNRWVSMTDERGRRRLDDPDDFVRLEITAALSRGVRVVPILVDGATMPRSDQLPPDLVPLTRRQAVEISPVGFNTDRLLATLATALGVSVPAAVAPEETAVPKEMGLAEVAAPEALVPEVAAPEALVPEVAAPEAPVPEAEGSVPEPDVPEPEAEGSVPEPDVPEPEPDVAEPEPEMAMPSPEMAMPEVARQPPVPAGPPDTPPVPAGPPETAPVPAVPPETAPVPGLAPGTPVTANPAAPFPTLTYGPPPVGTPPPPPPTGTAAPSPPAQPRPRRPLVLAAAAAVVVLIAAGIFVLKPWAAASSSSAGGTASTVITGGPSPTASASPTDSGQPNPPTPRILAHRGGLEEHQFETEQAMEAAATDGFWVETDVRFTSDGVAVLVHDEMATKGLDCGGRSIKVSETTWADLDRYCRSKPTAKDPTQYHVPRLEPTLEGIAAASPDAQVFLEVKTDQTDAERAAFLAAPAHYGLRDRTVITSARREWLDAIASADPSYRRMLFVSGEQVPAQELAGDGLWAVAVEQGIATQQYVDELHAIGVQVVIWVLNDPQEWATFVPYGPDIVMTAYPARFKAWLADR